MLTALRHQFNQSFLSQDKNFFFLGWVSITYDAHFNSFKTNDRE